MLIAAHQADIISTVEFDLIHADTRLLPIAFGICHSHNLMGTIPRGEDEKEAIEEDYKPDREGAEKMVAALLDSFPEGDGLICRFSVARAAGYFAKFRWQFPKEMSGDDNADRNRYDVYIIKACRHFWKPPRGERSARPKALFPKKGSIKDWARKYGSRKDPTWLTEEYLKNHEPIIKTADDLLKLRAASLLFAFIPDDKPLPVAEDRKECDDETGDLTSDRSRADIDPEILSRTDDERKIYLGPIIFTRRWDKVIGEHWSGDEVPELPGRIKHIPQYGAKFGTLRAVENIQIYGEYVKKCVRFGSNALVILFLRGMKRTVESQRFDTWKAMTDDCLEKNDFEVTKDEWERAVKYAPGAIPPAALVDFPSEPMDTD